MIDSDGSLSGARKIACVEGVRPIPRPVLRYEGEEAVLNLKWESVE